MRHLLLPILVAGCASAGQAPATRATPAASGAATTSVGSSIAARTAGWERRAGLVTLYLDSAKGRLLLELPRDSMRVLLFMSEATGLGSNPIGLDRGANGPTNVARFDRAGDRVLVVFENWRYRGARDNPANQRTVRESFPPSTVAALPLLAAEDGKLLVDATDFALHDWIGAADALREAGQGSYAVARDRSTIYRPYTKAFPENSEVDVALTFAAGGAPGRIVDRIVPDGSAFTIRQHLSFLALPDSAYRPRAADPRIGYFGVTFKDYGQPIQRPLDQRWIARHRLERVNPADPNSPIRDPIVYYIDRGIPEPIRTATKEGVSWWVEAFDRAGLHGAFRVEDLPEGVDPMDARYNVVQWVNRNERGWSVGGAVTDPRTGEIVKGMARLDSHRARTDYNLYAGLLGAAESAADTAFVLARVRQVSAHEVGHTLGLAHNYIASTYERGSVMDYPPPRVSLRPDGTIDVSSAYAVGPGPYDVWAIHWGYGIFPPGAEQDSLRAITREGLEHGYLFLSDADARPDYASDPRVNLWDDRASAADFLASQMAVREAAIARFGLRNIRPGEPVALLEERFVPVYFMHRFAVSSAARAVGGLEYANAVAGDEQQATRPVPAAEQRRALALLAGALDPEQLAVPDTVIRLLAPRPYGYPGSVELFGSRTRPTFDELGAARTLAQMIVDAVLQNDRVARLAQQAVDDPAQLSLAETIDALSDPAWHDRNAQRQSQAAPVARGKAQALRRVVARAVTDRLIRLAADTTAASEARAMADFKLAQLRDGARRQAQGGGDAARAEWGAIATDIGRWLEKGELPKLTPALVAPPGDPF